MRFVSVILVLLLGVMPVIPDTPAMPSACDTIAPQPCCPPDNCCCRMTPVDGPARETQPLVTLVRQLDQDRSVPASPTTVLFLARSDSPLPSWSASIRDYPASIAPFLRTHAFLI